MVKRTHFRQCWMTEYEECLLNYLIRGYTDIHDYSHMEGRNINVLG